MDTDFVKKIFFTIFLKLFILDPPKFYGMTFIWKHICSSMFYFNKTRNKKVDHIHLDTDLGRCIFLKHKTVPGTYPFGYETIFLQIGYYMANVDQLSGKMSILIHIIVFICLRVILRAEPIKNVTPSQVRIQMDT